MSAARVLLLICAADAHMMWLKDSCLGEPGCTEPQATVTFAEAAGSAEGLPLLEKVRNNTHVYVQSASSTRIGNRTSLKLSLNMLGEEGAELVASIPVSPPFVLELQTVFGLFSVPGAPSGSAPLLVYTASASETTRPHDWLAIQRAMTSPSPRHPHRFNRLNIDLRDPFMTGAAPGEGVVAPPFPISTSAANQCPPGVSWHDGDACVVAVVMFKGTLLESPHNITIFKSEDGEAGTKISEVATSGGLTVVRLPPAATGATYYYAQVSYIEPARGMWQGKNYSMVAHYATTSTILQRPPQASSPPPPSPSSPPPPLPPSTAPFPPSSPPPSPPPEAIPPWIIRQLSHNSFGGSFLAIFVWMLIGGASFGAYKLYRAKKAGMSMYDASAGFVPNLGRLSADPLNASMLDNAQPSSTSAPLG